MADQICIEVPQVLDFCFQTEQLDVCLPVSLFAPATCLGNIASCSLTAVSCAEVGRVASASPGFYDVTFLVAFTLTVNLVSSTTGLPVATAVNGSTLLKTVTLCAPDGASTVCDVTFSCGPCICFDDVVCCTFNLCLVLKSVFLVVLAVTGTVLTPEVCVTPSPFPPVCPPMAPTLCLRCPPPV